MSQLPGQPPREPKPPLYTWSEVWTDVITKPSVKTFTAILSDPAATPRRGLTWLYLSMCFSIFVIILSSLNTSLNDPALREQVLGVLPSDMPSEEFFSTFLLSMLCTVPFTGLLSIGFFMGLAYAIHFIANQFGPREQTQTKFPQLIYVLSAAIAPLNILSLILVIFRLGDVLGMVLTLVSFAFQMTLMLFGVIAVYGLRAKQAALALGMPLAAFMLFAFLLLRI